MITPSHLIHPFSHSTGQVPWQVSPSKLTPLVTQISASLQPSASTSPWQRCSVSLHNNGHCCKVQSSPLLLTCFGIHNDGTEQSVIGSLGTSHSFSLFSHSHTYKYFSHFRNLFDVHHFNKYMLRWLRLGIS